jgi:hypothetical protein
VSKPFRERIHSLLIDRRTLTPRNAVSLIQQSGELVDLPEQPLTFGNVSHTLFSDISFRFGQMLEQLATARSIGNLERFGVLVGAKQCDDQIRINRRPL